MIWIAIDTSESSEKPTASQFCAVCAPIANSIRSSRKVASERINDSATLNTQGGRSNVYVHAKIMLIDDAWATIGSCNLHSNSLYGHTEMNASFWDAEVVRALRCALLTEHLGGDTAPLDMRSGLQRYRDIAWQNRYRHDTGDPNWQGLAYRLDPTTYGE